MDRVAWSARRMVCGGEEVAGGSRGEAAELELCSGQF